MKVLVADDDPIALRLVEASLIRWGYEPVLARDGDEALNILTRPDAPALAVLDWMMPKRSGLDVCEAVRERVEGPYIYLMLLTSRSDEDDFLDGMAAGADDYLTKPFNACELQMRLRAGRRIVELQQGLLTALEEQKRSRLVLLEQHNQLRGIIDNVPDMIYVRDRNGRFVVDNAAHLRSLGEIDPDRVIGRTFFDYLPDEQARALEQEDETVLAGGIPVFDREESFVGPEGLRRWQLTSKIPIRDERGNATGLVSVTREVTANRSLEAALRESEERFMHAADPAPFPVWMSDVSGRIIYMNRMWMELTGRPIENALGMGWLEVIHGDDRTGCLEAFEGAAAARRPFRREYRLLQASGEYRWFFDAATPRYAPGGVFCGYVGACTPRPHST